MKKLALVFLLLFSLPCALLAQTTVSIDYVSDSIYNPCSAPTAARFYIYGNATGYDVFSDTACLIVFYGDGTNDTTKINLSLSWNSPLQPFGDYVTHVYNAPGSYTVKYKILMPDGNSDSLIVTDEIVISNSCGNITGQIYNDLNGDCTYNTGDQPVSNLVKVYKSGTSDVVAYGHSDPNGNYAFNLPTGITYDIKPQLFGLFTNSCPATGILTTAAPATGQDFALTCPTTGWDLFVHPFAGGFLPGRTNSFLILSVGNGSCNAQDAVIKVISASPLVSLNTSTTTPPDSINGDTLFWSANNLSYDSYEHLDLRFITDTLANIGDTICFEVIICPVSGDADPSNNTVTICTPVAASYDPNNKLVTPTGTGTAGSIAPNQQMTYTINFQNTGTAPALNVVIRDTIDTSVLDFSTFQLIGSSHPLTKVHVLNRNELKFDFNGINLPDSTNNEPDSHGWVQYSMQQQPNLAPGTVIQNRAGIYFDWNPPIITEYATNTIGDPVVSTPELQPTDVQLATVFPNPTMHHLNIVLGSQEVLQYQLIDLSGKVIAQGQFSAVNSQLSVQQFPEGMYLLNLWNTTGHQVEKVGILR